MKKLELNSESLSVADERCACIVIPQWVDLAMQPKMISKPKGLKSHDWKQVNMLILLTMKTEHYFSITLAVLCNMFNDYN